MAIETIGQNWIGDTQKQLDIVDTADWYFDPLVNWANDADDQKHNRPTRALSAKSGHVAIVDLGAEGNQKKLKYLLLMPKRYCYLEPKFPAFGYAASIFIRGIENETTMFFPIHNFFADAVEAKNYIRAMEVKFNKNKIEVYGAIMYKIVFREKIGLAKDYWEKSTGEIGKDQRNEAFLAMAKEPKLYRILVTPRQYFGKTKIFSYSIAYPFYISSDNGSIEAFMSRSSEPVDIRAKYAATYTVEESWGINWTTGKTRKVEEGTDVDPGLMN